MSRKYPRSYDCIVLYGDVNDKLVLSASMGIRELSVWIAKLIKSVLALNVLLLRHIKICCFDLKEIPFSKSKVNTSKEKNEFPDA